MSTPVVAMSTPAVAMSTPAVAMSTPAVATRRQQLHRDAPGALQQSLRPCNSHSHPLTLPHEI
eukprot:1184755-Prorocentrum_minimum.AAC.2